MACKIEIEKTINKSIDKELPNREALLPESVAISTRDKLNTLWSSAISKVIPVSDRFKVVINNLTDAINKEYTAQVSAEKDFEENLDFFEEDAIKQEQEKTIAEKEGLFKPSEEVNFEFKAAKTLSNNIAKANQWFKQMGDTDAFWNKIQKDLQIPKDQVDLLKASSGSTPEEKLASFAANYTYTVEVNLAKEKPGRVSHDSMQGYDYENISLYTDFTYNGSNYNYRNELDFDGENYDRYYKDGIRISKKEYEENAKKNRAETEEVPTQHYAGLSVSGGTNYTENEILTPGIVPTIKGHAGFATENGIGWFRSDDQVKNTEDSQKLEDELQAAWESGALEWGTRPSGGKFMDRANAVEGNKTRRILEVQSDLFQKGRDKSDLVFGEMDEQPTFMADENQYEPDFYAQEYNYRLKAGEIKPTQTQIKQNQFLQLLNKSNNWVTFFVKSIVQDSAKQGYKKVLFPTGNTASKVEGHTTLEEFKKQKESRLKQVNEALNWQLNRQETYPENDYSKEIDRVKTEKEQLEKELSDIEGPEGFSALKPIYNFYENVVSNVLKKQGLNPTLITDEFGNTWNEVEITPQVTGPIYLQKAPQKGRTSTIPTTASPKTVAVVKDFLKRIGVTVSGVNKVVVGGVPLDANGAAVMTQHLVQVVNGKEAQALPEEAMHFAVEILEQKNPGLFNKLMKEINSYQIYKDVLVEYGTDPLYTTPDGKPDIRKLKKEAIAKVLVETIINQNEDTNESPEKIKQAQTWWDQIVNYLKELFLSSGFDTAAMKILSGDSIGTAADIKSDSVYLQKSKQDEIIENVLAVHDNISLDPVKNPEGGETNRYFISGKEIKNRVSDLTKTWYDKLSADSALTNSEYQNAVNTLKADKGTDGHHDLQYIHSLFFDKLGYRRAVAEDDSGYQSRLNKDDRTMYQMLKDNYEERINTYPEGTRILAEITVYDPKHRGGTAGTIDYMAVMPDGKIDLLDWKFKVINTEVYEDIPWYNIASWNRQMGLYKSILQNSYGVKSTDFRQTMMVPIRAHYTLGNAKGNIMPKLESIEIGDVNIKNITDDYLIPVGLESQKTGIKKLDVLLEKLNALHKKLSEKKVLPSEKANKNEQLNALFKAIRHLQMKQSIEPLLDQAKTLNKQMELIMNKYNNTFKGKDKSNFTDKQIDDFAEEIHLAEEVLDSYQELNNELKFMFQGKELTTEEKALKEDLREVVEDIRDYKASIAEMYTEFTVDFIGGTETAEKIVKGLTKWFGSTATIQLKGLEDLYKKANKAFAYTGMDVLKETKRLRELKDSFTNWATAKGLTQKDMFNAIKKADKNELIDEFDPEFYTEMKKRTQNKDYAWIKDNIDVEAYEAHLNKKLEEELLRIESKAYAGEERKAAFAKESDIRKAQDKYSINTDTSVGWLLYNEVSKFPDKEKWESNEWKELHKPENKPALDFYNYIRERNEFYASIGYINNPQARKFLPWVRKSFFEKVVFDGKVTLGEQFLRNISIDESDVGYGKIDPITGKPIDSLPKYFTSEIEDASGDLFKTMELYNEMAIKFAYLSEIENQGRALIRLEKNKKAIATSVFGRTSINSITGELELNPNNTENSNLVESMVKAIIYQQKYIESETFDQLLGSLGKATTKINKTLGFKLLPENLDNRQVSVNKSISTLNNFFQVKTLGLNPLSSLSNLFGGKTQSLINSGKYFTKGDFVSTEMWLLANKMNGTDKQKMLAALEYFLPFTHDYNRDNARKLSLNKLDDQAIQDFLMSLMRKGEDAVQTTNFYAFLRNSIVQDNKVVNTREYLRTTPEYSKMYEGTKEEREAREARFEEDVKKLNESQGIIKLGTVVNGEFNIPGIDQKDDSVIEFRRKVQQFSNDALGSASEENKRTINMTVYGNSFMIFKNWIPRLVDVRMGGLKYNAASDAYEWGRMRTVTKIIGDDFMKSLGRLHGTLTASDKGIEYLREMYEAKSLSYAQETGKTLEMTEDQFIELVRQNVKNQLLDVLIYGTLFAIFWGLKANAPDDDEDPQVKNVYKFFLKATDKFKDEIGYFYDPSSFSSLFSTGLFPSIGLINDYKRLFGHTMTEIYGLTVQDDELVESNQTIKYWLRTFPVLNQGASLLPMFYPDLAKDLGIKMQGQYGFR